MTTTSFYTPPRCILSFILFISRDVIIDVEFHFNNKEKTNVSFTSIVEIVRNHRLFARFGYLRRSEDNSCSGLCFSRYGQMEILVFLIIPNKNLFQSPKFLRRFGDDVCPLPVHIVPARELFASG